MKCQSCGNELHIEDEKCPYCGSGNPHYRKHRQDMHRYQKEFSTVKREVYKKTRIFTGLTVKISVIAVLVALEFILLFMYENAWGIARTWITWEAEQNLEQHREMLDKMEKECSYIELGCYYEYNGLRYVDELAEYKVVASLCDNYSYMHQYLASASSEDAYLSGEELAKYLCETLEYIYKRMEQDDYTDAACYRGQHMELIENMKEDIKCMLVAYANIPLEEAENFAELSSGMKRLALERGLE